ncbi:MAG: endonuclease/exonuclease/phosphatase family protein [Planctomycetota bacterium]|nr:endonuclease/exonuclease/phosphatase family protein [Planctomycetota bacterium]
MSSKLRIATWNIHKGIGTDRRYRLDRIIAVLHDLDADVVCLQEVDRGVPRSSYEDQSQRLAHELGYPYSALGLNVRVKNGMYGNLTLSRHPLGDVHNVDLTIPPKKRRSGLVTRIKTGPAEGWLLANVHLGLMHLERRIQVRRLLAHLFEGSAPQQPLVIAGDWNEWTTRLVHGVMKEFGFHLARTDHRPTGERTWPSRRPIVALDKILYRDPIRCHHVACVLDEVTRVASDHLPLMVELETPITHRTQPSAVSSRAGRG